MKYVGVFLFGLFIAACAVAFGFFVWWLNYVLLATWFAWCEWYTHWLLIGMLSWMSTCFEVAFACACIGEAEGRTTRTNRERTHERVKDTRAA